MQKNPQILENKKVTINNIVIKDSVGYIDRNNTVCEDDNCTTRKELRGYKNGYLKMETGIIHRPTLFVLEKRHMKCLKNLREH